MSKSNVEDLVEYQVPEGAHVLSVYLQTHSAESETVFVRESEAIRRCFETESGQREFDDCVQRVRDFLSRFETRASMLVVICSATGPLWVRQLDVELPNAIRWGEEPYWKPLVEAIDEFEPYAVLLMDGMDARLFVASMGKIHEHLRLLRGHSESEAAFLQTVTRALEDLMNTESPTRLVLAGERSLWAKLLRTTPEFIQKTIIAMVHLGIGASGADVLKVTREVALLAERRFELHLVDDLVRLAAGRRKVALGLKPTLDALNDGKVWRLVYSETFAARGGHCLLCDSHFNDENEVCSKCSTSVRPEDDLMSAMISRALRSGASIEQVRGGAATHLNKVGGVGAFLRF